MLGNEFSEFWYPAFNKFVEHYDVYHGSIAVYQAQKYFADWLCVPDEFHHFVSGTEQPLPENLKSRLQQIAGPYSTTIIKALEHTGEVNVRAVEEARAHAKRCEDPYVGATGWLGARKKACQAGP